MSASDIYEVADAAYLSYQPTSTFRRSSYSHYLDRLGFGSSLSIRTRFIDDCKNHINASDFRFALCREVPEEYKKMVLDFLQIYGDKYWGYAPRAHLTEPDVMKGFLVPRDAHRKNSRLVHTLVQFFGFKASNIRKNVKRRHINGQFLKDIDTRALTWDTHVNPKSNPKQRPAGEDSEYSSSGEPEVQTPAISISNIKSDMKHKSYKPLTAMNTSKRQLATEDFDDIPLVSRRPRLAIGPDYNDDSDSDSSPFTQAARKRRMAHGNTLTSVSFPTPSPTVYSPLEGPVARGHPVAPIRPRPALKIKPAGQTATLGKGPVNFQPSQQLFRRSSAAVPRHEIEEDEVFIFSHLPIHQHHHHQPPAIKSEEAVPKGAHKRFLLPAHILATTLLIVKASTQTHMAPAIVRLNTCPNIHELFSKLTSKCGIITPDAVSTISATYTWCGKEQRICRGDEDDFEMFCAILRKAWEKDSIRFRDECEVGMVLHVDA